MTTLALGAGLILFVVTSSAPAALAVTSTNPNNTSGQALEIAPPVLTLNANPGQTIRAQISLRDISSGNLLVQPQANDFVAAGEDGTPKILTDPNDANPYSLRTWVSALPSFIIKPREIKNVTVTINVPANAAPGGHYGVIRFTATPPELSGTGVSLSASLGALLLVTVSGNTTEKLNVASFTATEDGKKAKGLFESAPILFVTRLKNTGNVHEQPIGQIKIKDMFGRDTASLNVNLPPRNVLPDSIRRFESPLDSSVIGNKKLFGRYTAALTVTYGADKQVITDSVSFWVIPYRLIIGIIIGLVGGFFLLRYLIARYNRTIISRSQRRR